MEKGRGEKKEKKQLVVSLSVLDALWTWPHVGKRPEVIEKHSTSDTEMGAL